MSDAAALGSTANTITHTRGGGWVFHSFNDFRTQALA